MVRLSAFRVTFSIRVSWVTFTSAVAALAVRDTLEMLITGVFTLASDKAVPVAVMSTAPVTLITPPEVSPPRMPVLAFVRFLAVATLTFSSLRLALTPPTAGVMTALALLT